jgi:hypothetical protein
MPRSFLNALCWLAAILLPSVAHAGYDQYFIWKIDPPEARLSPCVTEMKLLVNARQKILSVTAPDPKLQGADAIHFNGIGDDEYEDFLFPGSTVSHNLLPGPNLPANLIGFNPCKTEWKPYDEVVTACLIVARDHFTPTELQISSDGSWDDWQAGRMLYERVLGRTAHNPLQDFSTGLPLAPVDPVAEPTGLTTRALVFLVIAGIVVLFVLASIWLERRINT